MKSILLFLLCLVHSKTSFASYPELFGASFTTSSIGNQSNLDRFDPSNNYYAPSLLGLSSKFTLLTQATSTATHFKRIDNIVITNSTNSNSGTTYGSANTSYSKFYGGIIHASVPVGGSEHLGTIGLSIFTPMGSLAQTNSGDPFLPEYVMFHSRYQRTSIYLNFAKKWNDDFAWSLGALLGFQATAEVKSNMSLNGATYGSWARSQSKIAPSIGAIVSAAKLFDHNAITFTYTQEMKSNLKASILGEITNPSLALFQSTLSSLLYYDPHTFRLGSNWNIADAVELFGGVEYQLWGNYKTPVIGIAKTGGVIVPSSNYEKVETRNTINPRLGMKLNFSSQWSAQLGAQYRMTPLKGDFQGSGNSVDVNTVVGAAGLQYKMQWGATEILLGGSLQYHRLQDKKVTKTDLQENGTAGQKIGSPGYNLGGSILAGNLGMKFIF